MLNEKDVDDLLEAVEAWKHKEAAGEIMGMLVSSMMARTPEQLKIMVAEREKEKREKEGAQKRRCERAIMLMAKLIGLRDCIQADAIAHKVSAGG